MTVNETVPIPEPEREPVVHFDGGGQNRLITSCGQSYGDLKVGEDVSYFAARVTCPACRVGAAPPADTSVVHYDLDNVDLLTGCGLELNDLTGHDRYSTDPAAVDCPRCVQTLGGGQLIDLSAAHEEALAEKRDRERTEWREQSYAESDARKAAPERRTVGLEVLTDELRAAANAAIVADFRAFPRDPEQEPELLPPESRTAVVVRADGQLENVTDVETDVPQRDPAGALAWMLGQALGRARNLDAELLMPGADVLAALAGQPVSRYTASVPSSYGVVEPGWYVGVETVLGDGTPGHQWLLVEDRSSCDRPAECVVAGGVAKDCAVVTMRGRGIQHLKAWYPAHVRIPATTEVEL